MTPASSAYTIMIMVKTSPLAILDFKIQISLPNFRLNTDTQCVEVTVVLVGTFFVLHKV